MKRTRHFLVNIIFDSEYNGYVADVPQLPGCMSQGKTAEAALKNVRKAIAAYLKASREVSPFLLRSQIKRAGLTEQQFLALL